MSGLKIHGMSGVKIRVCPDYRSGVKSGEGPKGSEILPGLIAHKKGQEKMSGQKSPDLRSGIIKSGTKFWEKDPDA